MTTIKITSENMAMTYNSYNVDMLDLYVVYSRTCTSSIYKKTCSSENHLDMLPNFSFLYSLTLP